MTRALATGEIDDIRLQIVAVSRAGFSPTANSDLAYKVRSAFSQSSFFTPAKEDDLEDIFVNGQNTNVFSFRLTVHLKTPFKL